MLKNWDKRSVQNISEIENLLRRRKKAAGKDLKKKKNSARTKRAIKSYLWKRADDMVSKGKYEGEVLEAILDSYWQNKRVLSPSRRKKNVDDDDVVVKTDAAVVDEKKEEDSSTSGISTTSKNDVKIEESRKEKEKKKGVIGKQELK